MPRVIAIIPARSGSKGIPSKNFLPLAGGRSPLERAIACAAEAGIHARLVTTDHWPLPVGGFVRNRKDESLQPFVDGHSGTKYLARPAELAQDDTPMIDVVRHALDQVPGAPDDIVLLVQPTQPLRQPKHLQAAIQLLQDSGADRVVSVVSVVEVPLTHSPWLQLELDGNGQLRPWDYQSLTNWSEIAECPIGTRQACPPSFIRDGTVYAVRRSTVAEGALYGRHCLPLLIPAEETCPLDTPADWLDAERRLRAQTP